jgi:hypothetical protein
MKSQLASPLLAAESSDFAGVGAGDVPGTRWYPRLTTPG